MVVTDEILNEWSFRCHDGVVDLNNPKKLRILKEILDENGIDLKQVEEDKKPTKKAEKEEFFVSLSKKTQEQYSSQLGKISEVFNFPYTIIENWRDIRGEEESSVGKSIEQVLVNYSNSKIEGIAKRLSEKGNDILVDGKKIEVKSSEKNTINTILQTSFYADDPNKFYAFVLNTASSNIDVMIVNSQLLHNYYLGEEIINTYKLEDENNILVQKIKEGIDSLQFDKMILSSLVDGKVNNEPKSFKIGKVRIRFILNVSTD
jgi:hypothetical protein